MSAKFRELSDTLLHEGYLLYPYRSSALKNRHRYPFGTLYPEAFCRAHQAGDTSFAQAECVALGSPDARISVQVRFLQWIDQEAVVREARVPSSSLAALATAPQHTSFEFLSLRGELSVEAVQAQKGGWKVCVRVRNATPLSAPERTTRDDALRSALGSAHLLVTSEEGGKFISLMDPPEEARELAEGCRNIGLWPVLVGETARRDMLLAAPIILYDYPELAPESPGDFYDGTEIDALLTLRVLTLTDEEKREMLGTDARSRALLERTEASGLARLAELRGRMRRGTTAIRPGASVLLRPKVGGDVFDLALAGKRATVQAVERDLEGRTYIAVTVDEDPGRDLGAYGHRFFFWPEEVELL